jgi:phenylacetate-CoA ligase
MSLDIRVRELVAFAYDHSPAIRSILEGAGLTPRDIQGAADLAKIPVTSKDRLVEIHQANPPFGGFLTVPIEDLPRIYISPGPIYDPQPVSSDPQALLEPFRYVGFGRGDRVLNTFMYHLSPAGILMDEALRAVGATVIPTGPGNTELQIMMMTALGATGFVGQPSYLMTLLDTAAKMGIPSSMIPIKKALFSAEPYLPFQQARFEGEYGMVTTSAYGTADVGVIGYSMRDVQGFRMMPHVHIDICDPTSGEPVEAGSAGEVVVTTFNRAYPLIRFGTGDLGALAPQPDPRLDGAQQLLGLFGRSGDAIKVRGMFLHPNQIMAAMARLPQVRTAQAVITRVENRDVLTMRVELHAEHAGMDVDEPVKNLVQATSRLRVDVVEVVPAGGIEAGGRTVRDERQWG